MRNARFVAAAAALGLMAGCAAEQLPGAQVDPNGVVTILGMEPTRDLLPTNSTDPTSADFLDAVYAGLLAYRPDGSTYNRMAESFTTTDSKTYHVRLKKGWQFHDGTEVKAHNFIDAWNYAAYAPNGQLTALFFEQIAGYDDVHPADPDGKAGPQLAPEPKAKTLSGLRLINDHEFDITLKTPFSVFPTKIGYTPFAPLPDKFFADPKAFAQNPIGNGPMRFVSRTPNQDIKLTRFDGYQGENKVRFKDLTIRMYAKADAAYKDLLAGNLDFMDAIPPAAKAGGKYREELGDRVVDSKLFNFASLIAPSYRPEYTLDVRRAISMAINREQILKNVLQTTNKPADGWVPEGLEGYEPNVCGEYCTYNPEKAKELLTKAGFRGKITISANADGAPKDLAEAECNSIRNALGVECEFLPSATFGQYRTMISERRLPGLGTNGWGADYPSIENFLNPVVKTNGTGNDANCSDKELDALLERADAVPDKAEAIKLYQRAHRKVAENFCTIPIYFGGGVAARSKNLRTATTNFRAHLDLSSVEVLAK